MHRLLKRLNGGAADVLVAHTSIDSALGTELIWDAKTLLPATHLIVLGFRQSEQDLVRWIEAGPAAKGGGRLNPHWKCMMRPATVLDYIVFDCPTWKVAGRPLGAGRALCELFRCMLVAVPARAWEGQKARRRR
ncbi:MAG: hypothetical protein ABSG53_04600 [Thermoguttaceae bacterium]|jgi:hypothetical protein